MRRLSELPLSSINGLHPSLTALRARLSIPPLGSVCATAVDTRSLRHLARITPIRVTQRRTDYVCTGNVRLYNALRAAIPEHAIVPVLVDRQRPLRDLHDEHLTELLLMPALVGLHTADIVRLFRLAKHLQTSDEFANMGLSTKADFGRLFRLSPGKMRSLK